jgi:hypothetical protein
MDSAWLSKPAMVSTLACRENGGAIQAEIEQVIRQAVTADCILIGFQFGAQVFEFQPRFFEQTQFPKFLPRMTRASAASGPRLSSPHRCRG